MSEPLLKLLVRNRLLGTFPDCSPSRALEYPSSTSSASSSSTTAAWKTDDAGEDDASKHMETGATNACADRPLLLQKQKYLISLGSKAKVSHIMLFPHLLLCPCSCLQKEAISRNLKLNVRPGANCPEPLPSYLPSVALECSSSTANMSRIPSANASRVWIC
ncbi:hypothetical protein ACFX1X_023442 [Malus domestica]